MLKGKGSFFISGRGASCCVSMCMISPGADMLMQLDHQYSFNALLASKHHNRMRTWSLYGCMCVYVYVCVWVII